MLVAKNQEIDLGNLRFGVPHKFDFELINKSVKEINITKIILGCHACTQAELLKNKIGPNEETTIKVIFTPGSTGVNNKSISVIYGTTVLKLKFKAIVNK